MPEKKAIKKLLVGDTGLEPQYATGIVNEFLRVFCSIA
jgi:hypothetical protein